jgi:uncharacterized lipoprotein NlpE involved in copper resistance
MKRIVLLMLIAILCITLFACDKRKDKDLSVNQRCYVEVTDYWSVSTYNGYICTEYHIQHNDDKSYTVTFEINKPFKGKTSE